MKMCPGCNTTLPLASFYVRPDGRPTYCKPCLSAKTRIRRKAKPYVPAHVPNPLNSLLRDMPGSRVSLLGIAGVRTTAELRAA